MAKPVAEQLQDIARNRKKRSLDYSIRDGAAYSAMVGVGEKYFPAFAVSMKATTSEIAMLSSIPQLTASAVQLFSSNLVEHFNSRKKVILFSALAQAVMFIPILLTPFIFMHRAMELLILLVAMYHVFDSFTSPPWNSLMGDLVPEDERGTYFGKRGRIIGMSTFLAFIGGGLILKLFPDNQIFYGFAFMFGMAFVSRIISIAYLNAMFEPPLRTEKAEKISLKEFLRNISTDHFGKFTVYLFVINFAVYLANPFFIVYMFRTLDFSYLQFTIVTALNVGVTYLTVLYWGRNSDFYGNRRIMHITGWLIPLNPLLWLLPFGFWYIALVNMWTGFIWAGFQISCSNFMFDISKSEIRAQLFSYYNFFIGIAVFAGAMIGGILATKVFINPWIFLSNLQFLFLFSGFIRLFATWVFMPVLKEVRVKGPAPSENLFLDLVAIRPMEKIANETVIGIYSVRDFGTKSYDFGKKMLEEGFKLVKPNSSRVKEIEEVLQGVDLWKRIARERELAAVNKKHVERLRIKKRISEIKNRKYRTVN
ncbi:MAG: hypothetical protein QS98_C0001G0086 [archaeon GW2011_AR3]|nr:MAG: hypothetical protein QS98_C0001G0086 [archaeon GW2011_AR3]MBS3109364.1 MFS transporter [Candidatus Woesearchaeota archaeon]